MINTNDLNTQIVSASGGSVDVKITAHALAAKLNWQIVNDDSNNWITSVSKRSGRGDYESVIFSAGANTTGSERRQQFKLKCVTYNGYDGDKNYAEKKIIIVQPAQGARTTYTNYTIVSISTPEVDASKTDAEISVDYTWVRRYSDTNEEIASGSNTTGFEVTFPASSSNASGTQQNVQLTDGVNPEYRNIDWTVTKRTPEEPTPTFDRYEVRNVRWTPDHKTIVKGDSIDIKATYDVYSVYDDESSSIYSADNVEKITVNNITDGGYYPQDDMYVTQQWSSDTNIIGLLIGKSGCQVIVTDPAQPVKSTKYRFKQQTSPSTSLPANTQNATIGFDYEWINTIDGVEQGSWKTAGATVDVEFNSNQTSSAVVRQGTKTADRLSPAGNYKTGSVQVEWSVTLNAATQPDVITHEYQLHTTRSFITLSQSNPSDQFRVVGQYITYTNGVATNTTDAAWTVSNSNSNYVTVTPSSSGSGSQAVTVSASDFDSARTANIVFACTADTSVNETVVVNVEKKPTQYYFRVQGSSECDWYIGSDNVHSTWQQNYNSGSSISGYVTFNNNGSGKYFSSTNCVSVSGSQVSLTKVNDNQISFTLSSITENTTLTVTPDTMAASTYTYTNNISGTTPTSGTVYSGDFLTISSSSSSYYFATLPTVSGTYERIELSQDAYYCTIYGIRSNITINGTLAEKAAVSVINNASNVSAPSSVVYDGTLTISPKAGYHFDSLSNITVSGTHGNITFGTNNKYIVVYNVTSQITITGSAVEDGFTYTELSVSPSSLTTYASGGTSTLYIRSRKTRDYDGQLSVADVTVTGPSWCNISNITTYSNKGDYDFVYSIEASSSSSNREGTIVVSQDGSTNSKSVDIEQIADVYELSIVGPATAYVAPKEGTTTTLTVVAKKNNVQLMGTEAVSKIHVSSNFPWCTLGSPTYSSSSAAVQYPMTFSENTTGADRQVVINAQGNSAELYDGDSKTFTQRGS